MNSPATSRRAECRSWSIWSPRTGISCRTGCRWRARHKPRATRCTSSRRSTKTARAIEALGFHLHAMAWRRGSVSPFAFLANIRAVRRLYCAIAPDHRAPCRLAADHRRLACCRGSALRAGERARRARLCVHLRRAESAAGAPAVARPAALCARPCARDGAGAEPRRPRGGAQPRHRRRPHRRHRRLRRRNRPLDVRCRNRTAT